MQIHETINAGDPAHFLLLFPPLHLFLPLLLLSPDVQAIHEPNNPRHSEVNNCGPFVSLLLQHCTGWTMNSGGDSMAGLVGVGVVFGGGVLDVRSMTCCCCCCCSCRSLSKTRFLKVSAWVLCWWVIALRQLSR
eukprot:1921217-Amphidinium_carterae.1